MWVKVGRKGEEFCCGESFWRRLFTPEVFPTFCTSAFLSSLFSAPARLHAGYGHFEEVYSQLQPYKSEQPLGAVFGDRFLRHWAHAGVFRVGRPQGQPRRLCLVPSPRGGSLVGIQRKPKEGLLSRACQGRNWQGPNGLRETFDASRESAEVWEREGNRGSPGLEVSR